jgi:hypothetical protein
MEMTDVTRRGVVRLLAVAPVLARLAEPNEVVA